MNRVAERGERLTDECGHHCGIQEAGSVTIIGHCLCDECHDAGRIRRELLAAQEKEVEAA